MIKNLLIILTILTATSFAGTGTINYDYDNASRISEVKYNDNNGTERDVVYNYGSVSNSTSTNPPPENEGTSLPSSSDNDFFGCSLSSISPLSGVINILVLISGIAGAYILRERESR